ncbi:hypothetical protein [Breznakiella homolactica]|uniref:YkuD domain-containing protein n=1 Tax=Breznakiella homolactica TaxID=2798577 RepID=A0A7T7XPH5_9SPIR|nr:hypothetical protein [Breznakiella homolactica]QQO10139.1 hypothetical protein JFL75_04255 [Breznakiella homolactica]
MEFLIKADLKTGRMAAFDRDIPISCMVRNELNHERKSHELVYSIPDKHPIQPRPFPPGKWRITEPRERTDPYLAPFYIPSDAYQMLPVWEVENGLYKAPTDSFTRDCAYGLHYSTSRSTQGCIKILDREHLLFLADTISDLLRAGNEIYIEVNS